MRSSRCRCSSRASIARRSFIRSRLRARALFLIGLIGESTADAQLAAFKRNPANKGGVCDAGLWRYSRHPNYFFEWLIWIAYAVFALASPYGWIALAMPVLMLHFLINVTGLKATEEQALRTKGERYRLYQARTSGFIPWIPREDLTNERDCHAAEAPPSFSMRLLERDLVPDWLIRARHPLAARAAPARGRQGRPGAPAAASDGPGRAPEGEPDRHQHDRREHAALRGADGVLPATCSGRTSNTPRATTSRPMTPCRRRRSACSPSPASARAWRTATTFWSWAAAGAR